MEGLVTLAGDAGHFACDEIASERFRMSAECIRKIKTGDVLEARVVVYFVDLENLPAADPFLLKKDKLQLGTGCVDCCCQTCRSGTDDHKVVCHK